MYETQSFTDLETVLTAAHLQHMETGIRQAFDHGRWENLPDKPFEDQGYQRLTLLPQTGLSLSPDGERYMAVAPVTAQLMELWGREWERAEVTWDGTVYECTPTHLAGYKAAGNLGAMEMGTDTQEPFLLAMAPEESVALIYDVANVPPEGSTEDISHTLSVDLLIPVIKTLEQRFLPPLSYDRLLHKPFGTVAGGTVLGEGVAECTLQDSETEFLALLPLMDLIPGGSYTLELDGQSYTATAAGSAEVCVLETDAGALINGYIPDTTLLAATQGSHSYRLLAAANMIKTIDAKYLPVSAGLPAVTASDDGKFLQVVDGAWAAQTVQNAEEVSF